MQQSFVELSGKGPEVIVDLLATHKRHPKQLSNELPNLGPVNNKLEWLIDTKSTAVEEEITRVLLEEWDLRLGEHLTVSRLSRYRGIA